MKMKVFKVTVIILLIGSIGFKLSPIDLFQSPLRRVRGLSVIRPLIELGVKVLEEAERLNPEDCTFVLTYFLWQDWGYSIRH